jgi:MFS family permease
MAHPLGQRNFRLLFVGRVVDELGDSVSPAALTLAIVAATGSSGALAVVLAATMVPRLALLPLGGVLADRLGPRRVSLAADAVRAITQLSIAVELLSGHVHLAAIAVAGAVSGAASAFSLPATSPLVAGTVDEASRQAANSLMGIAASATRLAGPALAGVLIFTAGAGWAFVLDAATFAFSAVTLSLVHVRPVEVPRQSLREDLLAGWTEVRQRTWYWTSLIGHATWNFAAGVLATLGPIVAVTQLGGRGVWLAALQASAIGYLLGSMLAGRLRVRRAVLAGNLALLSYAAPLALFAVAAPAWAVVGSYGIALGCLGFFNPTWETVVQQQVPPHVLARVDAYDWLVSMGGMPLGYALGPALAGSLGSTTVLGGAAVLVVIAMVGPALVPDVRRLRLLRPDEVSARAAEPELEEAAAAVPAAL